MSLYPLSNRRTARIVALVSGFCFWIFSFVYLAVFQNDLLAVRSELLLPGKSAYNPWVGAVVITSVLWLLQRLIRKLKYFGIKGYAFSYLPSFVLLGVITFSPERYGIPLIVCVFGGTLLISLFFFAFWERGNVNITVLSSLNFNLQELLLLCCLAVSIGNTNEDLHHELSMASAFGNQEYDKVLRTAPKSISVSEKMADYRIRALAAQGELGERLFEYPQYYTSLPVFSEKDADTRMAFNYSVASKLLNRDLEGFYEMTGKSGNPPDTPPRHYTEAMILYRYLHPELSFTINDERLNDHFQAFLEFQTKLKNAHTSAIAAKNLMQREFGTTYWFYYMYK